MSDAKLAAARARAAIARERLLGTAQELQYRLKPSTLAGEAKDALRRKSEEIAEDAADVVRRRPVAASATLAGLGALLGLGFFARRRRRDADPADET